MERAPPPFLSPQDARRPGSIAAFDEPRLKLASRARYVPVESRLARPWLRDDMPDEPNLPAEATGPKEASVETSGTE